MDDATRERLVEKAVDRLADRLRRSGFFEGASLAEGTFHREAFRDLIARVEAETPQAAAVKCPECRGGLIEFSSGTTGPHNMPVIEPCPICKGKGKISERLDEVLAVAKAIESCRERYVNEETKGHLLAIADWLRKGWGPKREEERNG